MPTDLYRWEDDGALIHHCPICKHPLSHPRARTKCLGEHVECCKAFHPQLFSIGTSTDCLGCNDSFEVHRGRHRTIAEDSRKLVALQSGEGPPMSPIIVRCQRFQDPQDSPAATTKRQRKELKKAEKAAQHSNAITGADIDRVRAILYSNVHDKGSEFELALLQDQDIRNNLCFHANTSQGRDIRRELIAYDRDMSEYNVSDHAVLDCMEALGIKERRCPKNSEERKLLDNLKETIQEDLLSKGREDQEMMKRKAGFLRWANKNGYNKLMKRCLIWDWRKGAGLPEEENIIAEDENAIDMKGTDDNSTLPTDDEVDGSALNTPSDDDSLPSLTSTASTTNQEDAFDNVSDAMQVTPAPPPIPTLKFYHNNGLHHFKSHPNLRKQYWKPA